MKSAVVVFPGSNCDRDIAVALEQVTGRVPAMVWHRDSELPAGTTRCAPRGTRMMNCWRTVIEPRCGGAGGRGAAWPTKVNSIHAAVPAMINGDAPSLRSIALGA